jgi:hypothetical protein
MRRFLSAAMLMLTCCSSYAQVNDDFSDGDFTSNPAWVGDVDSFEVTGGQLKSKGSGLVAGNASLVTGSSIATDMEWSFWMRLNFNPSTSNYARYYLVSDQQDLKGSLNGYFVQLGGSTAGTDSISLFRQSGLARVKIIPGRPGTIGKTNNLVRVRVVRSSSADWTLYTDTNSTGSWIQEGTVNDAVHTSSSYTGFYIFYTLSNAKNFYLDDVYAGPLIIDSVPPSLLSATVLGAQQLDVKFSEILDPVTSQNASSYFVNNGIGNPTSAQLDVSDHTLVHLQFSNSFINGLTNRLNISNVKDVKGNNKLSDSLDFAYFKALAGNVIINEIMADPDPSVGLPAEEFVELFNKTAVDIDLTGWTLSDGSGTFNITAGSIPAGGFVILCASANKTLFLPYGNTISLSTFPSLNNSGDQLSLGNNSGEVINQVSFTDSWYQDAIKKSGGWTLELINPLTPCSGKDNWKASVNAQGGTPGAANSILSSQVDSVAPQWMNFIVTDSLHLLLTFSEALDSISVAAASFAITGSSIISIKLSTTRDSVFLELAAPLQDNISYTLLVDGLRDCWGNNMPSTSKVIVYYKPAEAAAFDILIHEIFPDPDPVVGLPNAEFIELYNRSQNPISLQGWSISDGGTPAVFPNVVIPADSFLIICATSNVAAYQAFGKTTGLTDFPSLNQEGDRLTLRNRHGQLVHQVHYSSEWYGNVLKSNGGWALEMVDATNPCSGKENWKASGSNSGGTPGAVNAVKGLSADAKPPRLLRAYAAGNKELVLVFDEFLDSSSILNTANYSVDNGVNNSVSAMPQGPDYFSVKLNFADSFVTGLTYTVTVNGIKDCSGNMVGVNNTAVFGLPQIPGSGELLINEILFNPRSGGVDFVEIYNRSSKVIDLKNFRLANADEQDQLDQVEEITAVSWLIFPGQYIVLTTDAGKVESEYSASRTENFIEISGFPSFNDDEGRVVLVNTIGDRYDQFNYSEEMHFALIDDAEGVSLERIDFNRPTADATNWHSAAASVNYATPGYRNSQYMQTGAGNEEVQLSPGTFSPDLDGVDDIINISYRFSEPGYVLNATIFDAQGRQVKRLLSNELLGVEGIYSWDGINDKNEKALIGIYVIYFEVFNLKGEVKAYKKSCVLAGKL